MKRFFKVILILFCPVFPIYSQNYIDTDLGKFNKNFQTDSLGDYVFQTDAIKKPPKGLRLLSIQPSAENLKEWKNRFENFHGEITYHPHRILPGDTAFVSVDREIVDTYEKDEIPGIIPSIAIRGSFVTNEEWHVFERYVLDSMSRKCYAEEDPERMLIPTYDEYGNELDEMEWKIDWSAPDLNRITRKEYDGHPFFLNACGLLYPPHEVGSSSSAIIDPRKLIYEYNWLYPEQGKEIHEKVPLLVDSVQWKSLGHDHFGDLTDQLVWYYNNHPRYAEAPVCNIRDEQARAFLAWKQKFHQAKLDKKNRPVKVVYSLPSTFERKYMTKTDYKVEVPGFDLSPWRITNEDYMEFIHYVRDSIAMRFLAEELGEEAYLTPTTDHEGEELYIGEWKIDWKSKFKWDKLSEEETEILNYLKIPSYENDNRKDSLFDPRKLVYEYFPFDPNHAYQNNHGDTLSGDTLRDVLRYVYEFYVEELGFDEWIAYPETANENFPVRKYPGMHGLGYANKLGNLSDVLANEDRSSCVRRYYNQYIHPSIDYHMDKHLSQLDHDGNYFYKKDENGERVKDYEEQYDFKIFPEYYDFEKSPEASVKINYSQAKAYYHWKKKQEGQMVDHDNVLVANYIPSEEEWKKIQAGEAVSKSPRNFDLPNPGFRYVVRYYPKPKFKIVRKRKQPEFVKYVMGGDQKLYKKGRKYAVYNYREEPICDFIYDKIEYDDRDGLYTVKKDGKYGKMDYRGAPGLPVVYDEIKVVFHKEIRYVVRKGKKWGAVDRYGEVVREFEYDDYESILK